MYAAFFGLKHEPFSIAPDPRYLFMSERHREALAHLLYGVKGGGGFVLLSGEIGAGKTTVCRCFLEQIPRRCNVAYIFNPKLTVIELLRSVCEEFAIPLPDLGSAEGARTLTVKDYLDPLNEFLLRTHAVGQNNVLIIDEAQMLAIEVLEQLRLLTNLETNERKLLQIILIGQPELRDLLARPELEQLAQRVIARYHLRALTEAETQQYIRHRLAVAGLKQAMPFDAKTMQRIHQLARGVPRRINLLCDRALLGAFAEGKASVDAAIVDKAALEVFDRRGSDAYKRSRRRKRRKTISTVWWGAGAVAAAALVAGAAVLLNAGPGRLKAANANAPAAAVRGSASSIGTALPGGIAAPGGSASSGAGANGASGEAAALSSGARPGSGVSSAATGSAASGFLTAAVLQTRFKSVGRDEKDAWRALASAWKTTHDPAEGADADPCQIAARSQLQCFRSPSSTLALIRQLDRPGILMLQDETDRPVYALLTGIGPQTATLRIGDTVQTVSLVSLATLWRGDFATLWRMPPGYTGKRVDNRAGSVASWVATRLATLRGESPLPAEALTDAGWKARLSAFQLAQGLKPDGVAGPTTFMQLNRAAGIDEPRLSVAGTTP